MFAPSSSDDDGAWRDDCGAHMETLTRLACRAQTLVADLLFAADAQDATFQLDRHPERADALFDFEYLRRPSACDARLSASPALRRVDETCRAASQSSVWRAYRSLANVVRWRASFVAFCEFLRERDVAGDASSDSDAGFVDRTYDSDTLNDVTDESEDGSAVGDEVADRSSTHLPKNKDGRRRRNRRASSRTNKTNAKEEEKNDGQSSLSFRAASRDPRFRETTTELVSLFASALLILDTRFDKAFLERVVVQRMRWSAFAAEKNAAENRELRELKKDIDPPEWDDVVALCRREPIGVAAIRASATKADRHGSSKALRRPVPGAGTFARFGLPDFVIELALQSGVAAPAVSRDGGWRARANSRVADDSGSGDDARGAREACLCLFFAPETLRRDHGYMRDVVDAHFSNAFVVHAATAGGLVVDLATTWFPFEAAGRALAHSRACVSSADGSGSEVFLEKKNAFEDVDKPFDGFDPSGSFFAHAGRRLAAARLVAERAARLTDAAADVASRLLFLSESLSDAFFDADVFVSAESLSVSLASLEALNANAAWLFAHAHAEDPIFREAFAKHAPAPETVVDATLDAATLELLLLEALDKALRVKNETWQTVLARAAANAEALVEMSSLGDGRDGDHDFDDTGLKGGSYSDAPNEHLASERSRDHAIVAERRLSTPTKPVPRKTPTTPKTPKTPARVPRRARYAKIRARLDALPASVSPALDSSAVAKEVASIARALERVEEEEASRASRERMTRMKESGVDASNFSAEGKNVDDEESIRSARARAHAGALRASLATAQTAASLHCGQARALEQTRDMRFRGAGPGGIDRGVLDEHVPYLRSLLVSSPASSAKKFTALVSKLACIAERRTLTHFDLTSGGDAVSNASDEESDVSWRRVSAYYAREISAFAEDVLRAAPETALDALFHAVDSIPPSASVALRTEDRSDNESADFTSSRAARLTIAAASAKAAALADGLLRVPRVRVGVMWLDPRDVLARGLRDALRVRIAATLRETLAFEKMETGLFGGVERRTLTPAEFLAKLKQCRSRVEQHKRSFKLAASFCAGGEKHALLSVAADDEVSNAVALAFRRERFVFSSAFDFDHDDDTYDADKQYSPLDDETTDETFFGRTLREMLRQTDPRRVFFLDARSGFVASMTRASSSRDTHSADETRVAPETFDCLADVLGGAGVRLARALLHDRAESSLKALLVFYGDKMDGGAAEVTTRVVAAAGQEFYFGFFSNTFKASPRFESTRDACVAADAAIAEALHVFEEASFFAEMREWCVDVGHMSLASRAVKAALAARRRESAHGARRARGAAATLKRASTRASDERPNDSEGASEALLSEGASRDDVSRWSTLMFLFTLSALPSYARDAKSGRLAPKSRDLADAPDAAAIVAGVLSVLARLDEGSGARAEKSPSKREPAFVSDSDDDEPYDAHNSKRVVGPFVAAYLGCLARHLRRFAARRSVGVDKGYGKESSSMSFGETFSAALELFSMRSLERGVTTSASPISPFAGVFGGGGSIAAEEEASTCAEWLETFCRLGSIPRRALYLHAPPYVLDNASTRWEE